MLVALLFSPFGNAEQEPEVDLGRAEDLMHCSIMTKQLKWTGYLPMSFAFEAYKPCKHLKDITQRNQCSNPIRSLAHKAKREQRFTQTDMNYCLSLIGNEMETEKIRQELNEQQRLYYEKMAEQ
ncbi:hypothetical protein OFO16_00740 [Vibrio natriegens]|uniref:hypothetical protein n=1 Tax=Vibrio natriegens TaxID=691 RepID=UPI0021E97E2E|nr:hypothetical protein [Vibrio natriegens]UYI47261.1 hypothetical protein OFO16_00740 [Vibrio natriegens]